jgi:CRISPR-associated protein (TIGR02710 family)
LGLRQSRCVTKVSGDGIPASDDCQVAPDLPLLPATVAQAVSNSSDVLREPVDLLVSLSGFSPETTILAFELLRPKRLMIVGSEATRDSVDVIHETLKLPLSRLYVEDCDPTDPMGIYQAVQKAATMAPRGDGPARVIIDITGGKKVMSASAALAAAQLDLPLCYIDGRFDPELRQSMPGTERLVIVPNPTALFGDRELESALVAFRHGAYAAAQARFTEVAEVAYEPARARFLRDLSGVYAAWCDLDFTLLASQVVAMHTRLSDAGHRAPAALVGRLREQLRFADSLVELHRTEREGPPLLLNFYLLGLHYQRLGRRDFAALLFYRTLESGFTQRLARIAPGFVGKAPDYALLPIDRDELNARYTAVASVVHNREVTALPYDIGLMDAALLLHVLADPMVAEVGLTNPKALAHLKGMVNSRNDSVLAHGIRSVERKACEKLENFALRGLRAFWKLEYGEESVDERIATLKFVVDV